MRAYLWLLMLALFGMAAAAPRPATAEAAPALYRAAEVIAAVRRDCPQPSDVLAKVLCDGVLRVGLRGDYHAFAVRDAGGARSGFEVDVAAAIASFLEVRLVTVPVDPKNRIPVLASGGADLVIATMGHTLQRDPNAGFVRPHYYGSRTVVVGPATSPVASWDDLRAGHSVCLPLGASFNITFVQHHIRILTFDNATALMDALNFGQCAFIAHDDTFFTKFLADPAWSARFAVKFGFAPLPWGMAVPPIGGDRFRDLLSALSVAWHADGTFLRLARPHHIPTEFLDGQRARFDDPSCVTPDGRAMDACLLSPIDTTAGDQPSTILPAILALEAFLARAFGVTVDLGVFKSIGTTELLVEAIGYSLAMVVGAMITTVAFAFLFAAMIQSGWRPIRLLARLLTEIGQSTPMPLLLFFGYVVAGGLTYYSAHIALLTAMIMLGFYNGAYAGQALHEARLSLQYAPSHRPPTLRATVMVGWTQLMAFLINATKGAPAADMIGVPEFLGVITDLTAHTRDRFVLYAILLVFYTALVLLAIAALTLIESRVIRRGARPS